MAYVPIVPPSARTRMSPRARELATQIEKAIQDFQRSYPDTPQRDVQEALRTLAGDSETAPASRRVLAMAVAGGIAALTGVLVFAANSGGGGSSLQSNPLLWLVASAVVGLAVVAVARRR
ncbi:MAG: hypothetical protein Q8W45_00440 [Candidatus Palauibacterales bacterium]|nr:hypothetical protein [Candidatus Palauibacterales bacterium]MDP2481721.1 hypothetical protein [Candidatus Palauibacterales bacterium]